MWIVFHAIFWDGNAANKQDIIDSLLSPGTLITGPDIITNITTGAVCCVSHFNTFLLTFLTTPSTGSCYHFVFSRSEDQFEGKHHGR